MAGTRDLRDPEHLQRLWEGRDRAFARKRHRKWVEELERYGFEVSAPEGYWGATEPTEVTRISA